MKSRLDRAVISLANGDKDALSTIYDLSARLIFSTAFAITANYQDAEDALQDTLLDIAKYADSFTGSNAKTWILTITRHKAIDTIRRRKPTAELTEAEQIPTRDSYADLEVFDLLDRLDEDERQIVTYRVYAKMPHKEIAAVMDMANSQKKYQRAIAKLRENLREDYKHEKPKESTKAVRPSTSA
jgi:RNA polymerase sigma-70 factor (ECF subfamily)